MKYFILFIILISPVLYSAGCNKNDNNPAETSEGKLLTASPWKRIAATGQIDGQPEDDTFTGQLPCMKDDLYIFQKDGHYVTSFNTLKCPGDDQLPENKGTKWNISADGKVLLIIEAEELGGVEFPYQIETLNSTTLKVKRVLGTFTVTETYTH